MKHPLFLIAFFSLNCLILSAQTPRIDKIRSAGTPKAEVYLEGELCRYYYGRGMTDSAFHHARQGIALAEQYDNDTMRIWGNQALAIMYHFTGQLDSAKTWYKKTYQIAERAKISKYKLSALGGQASIFKDQGKLDSALILQREIVDQQVKIDEYSGNLVSAYNNLAVTHKAMGDYEDALQAYYSALYIADTLQEVEYYCTVLMNIGNVLQETDRFSDAKTKYHEIIQKAKPEGYNRVLGGAYNNLSKGFLKTDQIVSAKHFASLAYDFRKKIKNPLHVAGSLVSLAAAASEAGDYNEAMVLLDQALEIQEGQEAAAELAKTYLNKAEIALRTNQIPEAGIAADRSISFAKQTGAKPILGKALFVKADVMARVGNYRKAYELQFQHDTLYRSILGEEHRFRMEELEVKYETLQDSLKITQQEIDLEQQSAQIQRKNYFLVGALLLLSLLSYLVFLLKKNEKLSKKNMVLEKNRAEALSLKNGELKNRLDKKEETIKELRQLDTKIWINLLHEIDVNSIQYLFTKDGLLTFHLKEGEPIIVMDKLTVWKKQLSSELFCQTNRFTLVNMAHVRSATAAYVTLIDGSTLSLGRAHKEHFQQLWKKWDKSV